MGTTVEDRIRQASALIGLLFSLWLMWEFLPSSTRALVRLRACRRLSTDLAHLAPRFGRVGLWLEASGWEGHPVLYGAAARCRLAADDLWKRATDHAW